jgi:predicted HTH transcriptional regulator
MDYLKRLIAQGEGEQLDFKKTIQDSRKIAKSMVAFANTRGGKLLIGIRDNGSIAGIQSDEEAHMIEAAALVYCKPELSFTTKVHRIEGKAILEVDIPKSENHLHEALNEAGEWEILIREKDECKVAMKEFSTIFQLRQKLDGTLMKFGPAENKILELIRLHPEGISSRQCSKKGKLPIWKASKVMTRLAATGIIQFDPFNGTYRLP